MSRTKNAVRNIFTGVFNKIIILIFPFLIRTVIIKKLGTEYLGLSSLFTSILQVLNLTELGFSSAIIFSLYKPIAEKDDIKICSLMNFYKKVYRVIGLIILVIGLIVLPFLPNLIKGSYPNDINLYILYLMYLFNTVITYYLFAYKSALLNAMQRNDIINNVNTATITIQYIFQVIILYSTKNYYIYILINIIMNIANNLIIAYTTKKKYPQYICKGEISKDDKKNINKRVYGLMIQKICATTRNSLDSIFLSMFLGLNVVAIYNNYYTIMVAITGILTIITSSITSSIGNSVATESINKNHNDMKKFNFMYMWISGWATVCLLCLFQPFMELWMGKENLLSFISVSLICTYFYTLKLGDVLSSYYAAVGLWYEGRYRAVAETVLNILLNYFLGKLFGVNGIIVATVISMVLINFGYGTTIIFKHYFKNISIFDYFKSHLLYSIVTFIACAITYLLCSKINTTLIVQLFIRAIICIIIPNSIYCICYFNNKEFKQSKEFIKDRILKNNYKRGI